MTRVSREKNREYQAKWFKENREIQINRIKELQKIKKLFIISYKENHPCTDCKKYYYSCQMQFDHTNETKEFELSKAWEHGWDAIELEISKCELVCANCHAIRTYKRLQLI